MRKFSLLVMVGLLALLTSWEETERKPDRVCNNNSFTTGERLEFKIHVGLINAATGEMVISDELHQVDGRSCYKMEVFGRTNGIFDWIIKVRDNWGTYVDTASILPLKSFRYIEEGKYRKNEIVYFDHGTDTASVHKLNKVTRELEEIKKYGIKHFSQELISGYYYLRTVDFNKVKKGDILNIEGFFDGHNYTFEMTYLGVEALKTKIGSFNAYVLSPIMPENSVFDGENSVKIWLSADTNKIPLKVRAELFIGALEIDIKSAEGVRKG